MRWILFLLLFLPSLSSNAQSIEYSTTYHTDTTWSNLPRPGMLYQRLSFGVYPEIQFINSPVIGVSASLAHLKDVEWTSWNRGVNLGFEFDPTQDFYGPKTTLWADMFALFLGLNASCSAMYYRQVNKGGLYLRPEIGIGIPRLHLKYGFGFRLAGDEIVGVQRHSLTLGYHFTLIKKDKL